jgi:hypothetical protein
VIKACATFPVTSGLGWDALHPRAIRRVSEETVLWLMIIIEHAEKVGEWPEEMGITVIVLLPKSDGGHRPIGLLPGPVRIWMRCRREVMLKWESQVCRPYLFAGKGKGADVAAWKQAARAEHAAIQKNTTAYAQALLDLVKAFERVQHYQLVRAARKLGYPMWILRLSIATYRMPRVVRIGQVVSYVQRATRGITAGSGFATTEMKLVMIPIVDEAVEQYKQVEPTLFVDDLSVEVVGPFKSLPSIIAGFVKVVAKGIIESEMELSATKCICNASTDELGKEVQEALRPLDIRYQQRVKSLGVGLGGGRRRNVQVSWARLKAYASRIGKFQRLQRAGVSTAKLQRTGAGKAMTYGEGIMGVSDTMLNCQRSSAAAATAIQGTTGGQNVDCALMMADGSRKGTADPAYDARELPIGQWAAAVWHGWMPRLALMNMVGAAKVTLVEAARPWARVYGPAAAFVMTCARLEWKVTDAVNIVTDQGMILNLLKGDGEGSRIAFRSCSSTARARERSWNRSGRCCDRRADRPSGMKNTEGS